MIPVIGVCNFLSWIHGALLKAMTMMMAFLTLDGDLAQLKAGKVLIQMRNPDHLIQVGLLKAVHLRWSRFLILILR